MNISIEDRNADGYPDIILKPIDGCTKVARHFINAATDVFRTYDEEFVDIGAMLDAYAQKQSENMQTSFDGVTNAIDDVMEEQSQDALTDIPGMSDVLETFGVTSIMGDVQNGVQGSTTIDMNVIDELAGERIEDLNDTVAGLCTGFKINGESCGGGLPLPFNMAFLSPGDYNIM